MSRNVTKCHENWTKRESLERDYGHQLFHYTLKTSQWKSFLKGSQNRLFRKILLRPHGRFSQKCHEMSRNLKISMYGCLEPTRTPPGRRDASPSPRVQPTRALPSSDATASPPDHQDGTRRPKCHEMSRKIIKSYWYRTGPATTDLTKD